MLQSKPTYPVLRLSRHGLRRPEQDGSAAPANGGCDDWSRRSELDRLFSASAHYVTLGSGLACREALGGQPASSVYCGAEIRDSCSSIVRDPKGQTTTDQA